MTSVEGCIIQGNLFSFMHYAKYLSVYIERDPAVISIDFKYGVNFVFENGW